MTNWPSGRWNIADGHGGTFASLYELLIDPSTGNGTTFIRLQRLMNNGVPAPSWGANGILTDSTGGSGGSPSAFLNADGSITEGIERSTIGHIYAQRISVDGTIATGWPATPLLVSDRGTNLIGPDVGPIGANDNLLVWSDYSDPLNVGLYAQRLTATGAVAPGWPAGGLPIYLGSGERLVQGLQPLYSDGAGGALFAWSDFRLDGGIYALRLQGDGTPYPGWPAGGAVVCDTAGVQSVDWFVPDGAGGLFVAWSDARTGAGVQYGFELYYDIYLQHMTGSGQVAAGWPVNGRPICIWDSYQWDTRLVGDGQGGVYLAWEGGGPQGAGIQAQHVHADGTLAAGWPEGGKQVFSADTYQENPEVAGDGAGGLWVSADLSLPDPITGVAHAKAYVQHVTGSGQFDAGWGAAGLALAPTTFGDQTYTSICEDGAGGVYVGWNDGRAEDEMYVQRVNRDGVVAAAVALASEEVGPDQVTLTWASATHAVSAATVERSEGTTGAWTAVGTVSADGMGALTYTDRTVRAGTRYGYRLALAGGAEHTLATWVEVPAGYAFALAGAETNPARAGALRVRFTLAGSEAATLTLYDVGGREVARAEVGALGAGPHTLAVAQARGAAPGLYWLRLHAGSRSATARVVLVGE
jgi:hypothetical protein